MFTFSEFLQWKSPPQKLNIIFKGPSLFILTAEPTDMRMGQNYIFLNFKASHNHTNKTVLLFLRNYEERNLFLIVQAQPHLKPTRKRQKRKKKKEKRKLKKEKMTVFLTTENSTKGKLNTKETSRVDQHFVYRYLFIKTVVVF